MAVHIPAKTVSDFPVGTDVVTSAGMIGSIEAHVRFEDTDGVFLLVKIGDRRMIYPTPIGLRKFEIV